MMEECVIIKEWVRIQLGSKWCVCCVAFANSLYNVQICFRCQFSHSQFDSLYMNCTLNGWANFRLIPYMYFCTSTWTWHLIALNILWPLMTAYDLSVRTCNDWEEGPFFLECRAKIGKMAWFPNFKFWIQRTFLVDFQYFSCDKQTKHTQQTSCHVVLRYILRIFLRRHCQSPLWSEA